MGGGFEIESNHSGSAYISHLICFCKSGDIVAYKRLSCLIVLGWDKASEETGGSNLLCT